MAARTMARCCTRTAVRPDERSETVSLYTNVVWAANEQIPHLVSELGNAAQPSRRRSKSDVWMSTRTLLGTISSNSAVTCRRRVGLLKTACRVDNSSTSKQQRLAVDPLTRKTLVSNCAFQKSKQRFECFTISQVALLAVLCTVSTQTTGGAYLGAYQIGPPVLVDEL